MEKAFNFAMLCELLRCSLEVRIVKDKVFVYPVGFWYSKSVSNQCSGLEVLLAFVACILLLLNLSSDKM